MSIERFCSSSGIAARNKENWMRLIKITAGYDNFVTVPFVGRIMKQILTSECGCICGMQNHINNL